MTYCVKLENMLANSFILQPKVWYKMDIFKPVSIVVVTALQITNIPKSPDINVPKEVNHPDIFVICFQPFYQ